MSRKIFIVVMIVIILVIVLVDTGLDKVWAVAPGFAALVAMIHNKK